MKRIDMAPGEPARYISRTFDHSAASRTEECFAPTMSEARQVDITYAFWISLFACSPAQLRQRLVDLDALWAAHDDMVERSKIDAAMSAITFVLRSQAAMPDAGTTLL